MVWYSGDRALCSLRCLQGYESFDKSKLENTSEEEVQTKVRLTALMTLGTRSTHELKFGEVQQALGLGSDSEVEAWVVRAIGKVLRYCPHNVCEHSCSYVQSLNVYGI